MRDIEKYKNQEYMDALVEDYSALFLVDLLNDSIDIAKIDEDIFGNVDVDLEREYSRFINDKFVKVIDNMYLARTIMFLDKDTIVRNLARNNTTLNVKTNSEDCRFLLIKIVKINDSNRYVAVKIYDETKKVNERNRFQEKISEEYSIIGSLASDYELIFCVCDDTNKITIYTVSEDLAHVIDINSSNNAPLEKKIDALFNNIICKEYYDEFRKLTHRETIIEYLKVHKTFSYQFKADVEGQIRYYSLRIAVNQYPINKYVFGLINETDAVDTKNKTSKAIKDAETLAVISELATGYDTVFIADLDRNEGKTLKISDYYAKTINDYDFNIFENSGYRQRIDLVGSSIVHPEDRPMFFEKTNVNYIKEKLKFSNSYAFEYRTIINKVVKHLRMRIAYIHGYLNKVVVGIKDVENEFQDKLVHTQLLNRALGYRNTLINTGDGYVEANITKNKIISEITNETDKTLIIRFKEAFIGEEYTYDDLLTWWADNVILDDKEGYKKICNCAYFKAQFDAGNTILQNEYRMKLPNGDFGYFRRTTYLNIDENGEIIGLTIHKNITSEYKNNGIIKALGTKYSQLYYVDLAKNEFVPYTFNKEDENILVSNRYNETVIKYVNSKVYASDKKKVLEALDINAIRHNLKDNDVYEITYRKSSDGVLVYSEIRIIKISEIDGEVRDVAIGLAERDQAISEKYASYQLANEYSAIYFIDLESDMLRRVFVNDDIEFKYVVEGKYSDAIKTYKQYVAQSFKDEWEAIDSTKKVQKVFASDNRKESVYYVDGYKPGWRRCIAQIAERKNDIPTLMVMSFMLIDENRAESLELNRKIAEQKIQLERQQDVLKNALELAKSASYAKTSFLNNMSHDIRTPMNSIIAYTELAKKCINDEVKMADYLDKISKSSEHLLSLINNVLDMSRIEAGKLSLSESSENLSIIVRDVRNIMASNAVKKNIHFYIELMDIKNENIVCDKLKLNEILINVISNAIKYSYNKGEVLMKVKQLPGNSKGYATYVFEIVDNGIGMSEEFVSQIFEPFARGENVGGEAGGTGLGMSITKSLVDLMGGKINVASKEGEGTTVRIEFAFKVEKDNDVTFNALYKKLKGLKALVVDDNENGRSNCVNFLSEFGVKADAVNSGEEAIKAVGKKKGKNYQLIIVDWLMPKMDGIETTKAIRNIVDKDVVILLSAYETHDLQRDGIKAGVNAFISKPVFKSNLLSSLYRIYCNQLTEEITIDNKLSLRGKKVLVVEDNKNNMEIAEELLTQDGIICTCVMNGKECIDYVSKARYGDIDLILMDIMMPIMDGYEATKLIREFKDDYISSIPIVAMTANVLEEDKKKALKLGMNDYITKPIDFEEFRMILAKYLISDR